MLIKSMTESTKQRVTGNWFVIWCCFCCTTLFDLCRRRPFESTKPIAFNVHLKRSLSKFAYTLGLGVYVHMSWFVCVRCYAAKAPWTHTHNCPGATRFSHLHFWSNEQLSWICFPTRFFPCNFFLSFFFNLNANGSALHKVAVYVCVFVCGRS